MGKRVLAMVSRNGTGVLGQLSCNGTGEWAKSLVMVWHGDSYWVRTMKNNGNARLASNATGAEYRLAWIAADEALQRLHTMCRCGDRAEVEIVLARQRIAESQALVWDSERRTN